MQPYTLILTLLVGHLQAATYIRSFPDRTACEASVPSVIKEAEAASPKGFVESWSCKPTQARVALVKDNPAS
jgi:hypothetical protein